MELFFPLLFLLAIALTGWIANLYLLYQFAVAIVKKTPRSRWGAALGVGWLCSIFGTLVYLMSPSGSHVEGGIAMQVIGGVFYLSGIACWIYGFFQHRKIRAAQKNLIPAAFQQGPDTWPPPPTI